MTLELSAQVTNRGERAPKTRPDLPYLNIFMTFAAHHIEQPLSSYYADHRVLVDANMAVLEHSNLDILQAISDPYREAADFRVEA